MRFGFRVCIMSAAFALASCSFGPRLQSALPQVRDVPVLANLTPRQSLDQARIFLSSRQYGLAIELFRGAGHDPALAVDSLNGLGIAYAGIGRNDLAERYFQKAMALRTDDERTRRNLATFYAQSGQGEKRAALMASGDGWGSAASAAVKSPDEAADPAVHLAGLPADVRQGDIRATSPLGNAFGPLLVPAGLPGRAMADVKPGPEVSVVCTADRDAPSAPDAMTLFRISIGEVFISSQPAGTSCVVYDQRGEAPLVQAMTNRDYLGLVAAYLDQLNRLGAAQSGGLT